MVWSPGVVKGLGMYSVCPPSIKKEHEAFVVCLRGAAGLWGSGLQGPELAGWAGRLQPDDST